MSDQETENIPVEQTVAEAEAQAKAKACLLYTSDAADE